MLHGKNKTLVIFIPILQMLIESKKERKREMGNLEIDEINRQIQRNILLPLPW